MCRKQQHFCTHSTPKNGKPKSFLYVHFGTMVSSLEKMQVVQKKTFFYFVLHIQSTIVCFSTLHTEAHLFGKNRAIEITKRINTRRALREYGRAKFVAAQTFFWERSMKHEFIPKSNTSKKISRETKAQTQNILVTFDTVKFEGLK